MEGWIGQMKEWKGQIKDGWKGQMKEGWIGQMKDEWKGQMKAGSRIRAEGLKITDNGGTETKMEGVKQWRKESSMEGARKKERREYHQITGRWRGYAQCGCRHRNLTHSYFSIDCLKR